MTYEGKCLCGCPVYRDEDDELVFTCTEYPCELERERESENDRRDFESD